MLGNKKNKVVASQIMHMVTVEYIQGGGGGMFKCLHIYSTVVFLLLFFVYS